MLGEHGLAWPWESLHVEALAWFDHWLKGQDTGILEGPRFRYVLPGAEGWRTADTWPMPDVEPPVAGKLRATERWAMKRAERLADIDDAGRRTKSRPNRARPIRPRT